MATYVIQVVGGREGAICKQICHCAGDIVESCYFPEHEMKKRFRGEWRLVRELLFPGYLFVETKDPDQLLMRLRSVPAFTRLLGAHCGRFSTVSSDELAWLDTFVSHDEHLLGMSEGVIEGDKVIVTDGPLKGHEAQIIKVDRHKRLAYMDVHMFGREKTVRVGLEIVARY